jgi:hypothetical protein
MEIIQRSSNVSTKRYIALIAWGVVAVVFVSLAEQWISSTSSDKQFTEYVQSTVRRAAMDRRSASAVRTLMLAKAEELSLPLQQDQISVTGEGERLRTSIAYDTDIKIPVIDRVFYRIEFRHVFSGQAIH